MPRKRVKSKLRINKLTESQFWSLWLDKIGSGYKEQNADFISKEERKQAWLDNRDALMSEWWENNNPGKRPGAWWEFEAPAQLTVLSVEANGYENTEDEVDFLQRWGLLEQWEIAALQCIKARNI
jgi:hypothetical protein